MTRARTSATAEPFGVAAHRATVLRAWADSPARFREDANAEEDLALGGYRDRAVVELAQNAADAAARAGVPGRLLLRLADGQLCASNTGEPLTSTGVAALASLRASAKRDASTVGRFGVGFAAVLALTDAPAVASTTGAVRFDRAATRAAVAECPALADELRRRDGHVPALRLPYADAAAPEPGWTTTVRLPLRDPAAEATARRLLAEVGPALLLALPALAEVVVESDGARRVLQASYDEPPGSRVLITDDGAATCWRVVTRSEPLAPALLADRPVEERARPTATLSWALPVTASEPADQADQADQADPAEQADAPGPWPAGVPRVVHAPTPTAEACGLPALLLGSFPLDPSRAHVAEGPLTDHLVGLAGAAYAELVRAVPDPALVPVGLPAGALDAALRRAVLAVLRETAFLPGGLRPADAVVVEEADDALLGLLADVVPTALPRRWTRARSAVEALGVPRLALADVVDALATVSRPPAWWAALYAALPDQTGVSLDELGALPVPLADGRTVRGPRGLLLPGPDLPVPPTRVGLRLVDPVAAHPLLARLGAVPASPATVLADPAVQAAVEAVDERDDDHEEAAELAEWVLRLVAASGASTRTHPWLAGLLLPDEHGDLLEPAEAALPGSPVDGWADEQAYARVDETLRARVGDAALVAVGVRSSLPVLTMTDWTPSVDDLPPVDAIDDWVREVVEPVEAGSDAAFVPEAALVEDLDLVDPAAWPRVLAAISADPALRAAVVDPVTVVVDGARRHLASYAGWWLTRHARLAGRRPSIYRLARDPRLAGLFDVLPAEVAATDERLLQAIGVRTSLEDLLEAPGGADALLDRLAEPEVALPPVRLVALYAALAQLPADRVSPPALLRAHRGGTLVVVPADQVVVLDRPDLLPVVRDRAHLRVPLTLAGALAEVLDLGPASASLDLQVPAGGSPAPVPDAVRAVLADAPSRWVEHDRLNVGGVDVEWLVAGPDAEVHAATLAGLARGLAWRAGRWADRHLVLAVLADPAAVEDLRAEADLDD